MEDQNFAGRYAFVAIPSQKVCEKALEAAQGYRTYLATRGERESGQVRFVTSGEVCITLLQANHFKDLPLSYAAHLLGQLRDEAWMAGGRFQMGTVSVWSGRELRWRLKNSNIFRLHRMCLDTMCTFLDSSAIAQARADHPDARGYVRDNLEDYGIAQVGRHYTPHILLAASADASMPSYRGGLHEVNVRDTLSSFAFCECDDLGFRTRIIAQV